jgi:hypothetical protein
MFIIDIINMLKTSLLLLNFRGVGPDSDRDLYVLIVIQQLFPATTPGYQGAKFSWHLCPFASLREI